MKWIIAVSLVFLTACTGSGIPLTQLSTGANNAFTERQSQDLIKLLNKLHGHIYYKEDCSQIRDALDNNATINSLERAYNLKPYFIYDEFIQSTNVTSTFHSPPQTTEASIMQNIIDLWKTEASS